MREVLNQPIGIKIFTDFMSYSEAEYIIDIAESATNKKCNLEWGIPSSHSPDISCFRNNLGFNISEHGFRNSECTCGLKELDALLGKTMLKALSEYNEEYKTFFTQDEGFVITRQGDEHIDEVVIDDNPFVNRMLSYNIALNVDEAIQYIRFEKFDLDITISKPSLIMFPSNFIYSYSKPKNEGLYEVLNYFNANPTQEVFDEIFKVAD